MIILGIDPWLETIWFWVISYMKWNFEAIDYWVIKTSKTSSFEDRLVQIQEDFVSLIEEFNPKILSIEKLYFWTNITNAISVAHVRWILVVEATKKWIPIIEFSPNEIKSMICWYWKAEKSQIQFMITEYLKLESVPRPDDVSDALAIAICWAFSFERN